jgi:hypothetical protein
VGIEVPSYRGFRYPIRIISHCVWLCYRFPLSFREVQEMMLQRGVVVSHETIRKGLMRCAEPVQARSLIEVGQIAMTSSSKAARTCRFTVSSTPSS